MVVFSCSKCGQSVKKNQVEKHCFQCRGCESLSCMDCGKVFWGDDYIQHTKCITENEKYGGKGFQLKPNSNKGEMKQEKWIEHVKNIIATKKLSGPLSNVLQQIVQFSNIPRKQSKFENFLKSNLKFKDPKLINQAWEIFAQSTINESNSNSAKSPAVNNINGTGKRPAPCDEEISCKKPCLNGNVEDSVRNFNWIEVMENILKSQNTLPLRILRKMVIAEYKSTVKDSTLTKDELKKKFKHYVTNSKFTVSKVQ